MRQLVLILIMVPIVYGIKQIEHQDLSETFMYLAGTMYGVTSANLRHKKP